MDSDQIKQDSANTYRLNEQIGFILRRSSQRHLTIFAEHIENLTSTQFAVLAKLFEDGSISQNELGRQTAMDGATIKGVIDRLRNRGLVKSRPDSNDKRRVIVELSDTGTCTFLGCVDAAHEVTAKTLEPLDPDEAAVLLNLLRKIS